MYQAHRFNHEVYLNFIPSVVFTLPSTIISYGPPPALPPPECLRADDDPNNSQLVASQFSCTRQNFFTQFSPTLVQHCTQVKKKLQKMLVKIQACFRAPRSFDLLLGNVKLLSQTISSFVLTFPDQIINDLVATPKILEMFTTIYIWLH